MRPDAPVAVPGQIACPNCGTQAFSVRQKYRASAFSPLECSACGALAAPSWRAALALMPGPVILVLGLWVSLAYRSWWPVLLALAAVVVLHHLVTRYFPLGAISRREVTAFRIGGALLLVLVVGSVLLGSV